MKMSGAFERTDFILRTKSGNFLLPNFKETISFVLFVNGYYEKGLIDILVKAIPANGVLIDVGANIGSISIPLSRLRPDIKIIAVEASPWIFAVLKKNVQLNNAINIIPVNYAVYGESGKTLAMYAPRDQFGKGSLKAVFTKEAEMVDTITIDDIKRKFDLSAIHFIKVDVEGFEASVFSGMTQFSLKDKPKIIFEFADWAELAAGFRLYTSQEVILSKGYTLQKMDDEFKIVSKPSNSVFKVKNANFIAY